MPRPYRIVATKLFVAVLLIAFNFSPLSAADEKVAPQIYQVGVAKIDITSDYPIRLSGFGFRRTESEGVQAHIYARALAIGSDEEQPAILMTVDSTGVSRALVDDVAKQLASDGVKPERLTVTATHTHTAPMLDGILPTLFGQPIPADHQAHIKRYKAELTGKLVAVARAALADRQPAQLWWGTGELKFSKNRRDPKNGPVDHGLPVLAVKSPTGELRAILATYACHAVTLSHNLIGGDWPGFAADSIERQHRDVTAMISIGCGADQNPIPGVVGDKVEVAESQGVEFATEVNRVLKNALRPIHGPLTCKVERFELPLAELPPRSYWEERKAKGSYIGYHAEVQLQTLDRGEALMTAVPYSVQTWTFGDSLAMVFLPGEVVVDYAIRLRKELDPNRLWIMAYANDTPCYIPSERVLAEGGYEGATAMTYYNKPNKFAPGLEQKIIDAALHLVPASFHQTNPNQTSAIGPPLPPVRSLERLKIPDDWTAQVVAAEPLTTDPVAFDFGPDGCLWVCEMHDYPSGLAGNFEPGGKVRILRDDNRDGIYDRSTVFLDGLPFPTGVTVWRKGVLVCAAPDIIYAEDTNGDDQADVKRVLFTGFGTGNYQARVNSLTYGLDGWVYGSCGLFGGDIKCELTGEVVPLGNRDFRIDPDRGVLEPLTGRSQQGRVRNDAGDWFGCSNGQPCWYYPILKDDSRPGLAIPPLVTSVPAGNPRQLFPETAEYQRFKLSGPAGQVTAACGIGIYRDDWLGHGLQGNFVVCEPVNLLLHRRRLVPVGLTFRGERADDEQASEVVTSTDNWFRPVQVRTGPDGGLWIADMSRAVIEHPRWIPEEVVSKLDVRAGDRQGRIIRLLPRAKNVRPVPDFSKLSAEELVDVLRSPNGTQRDLAQEILLWSNDRAAVEPLSELVMSDAVPAGRAAALWVLAKYATITDDLMKTALSSKESVLRRQAARIVADHGEQLHDPSELLKLLNDETDPFVLRELIQALRANRSPVSVSTLARLYGQDFGDVYLKFLVLRAVDTKDWPKFVALVLKQPNDPPVKLQPLLSVSLAARDADALKPLLETILPAEFSSKDVGLVQQIAEARSNNEAGTGAWLTDESKRRLDSIIETARETVSNSKQSESARLAAVGLLGLEKDKRDDDVKLLASQLGPQASPAMQQRIIATLGRTRVPQLSDVLISKAASVGPAANAQILELLLSRPSTALETLAAIQKGDLSPNALTAALRQSLLQHPNERVRQRAQKVLQVSQTSSRKEVVAKYRNVLELTGSAERGAEVYQKKCSVCHRVGERGHAVGPDLSESRNKSWSALLNSLLDPNQAVDQRFNVYVVATDDGRVLQGLLEQESRDAITIKGEQAKLTVVPRNEIDVLKRTDRSMMPEGLEKDLSPQDFADLFSLITGRTESGEPAADPLDAVAAHLLDDSRPRDKRIEFLNSHLNQPAELIAKLTAGLPPNDAEEEYRRIPWIWRVAIATGRANRTADLKAVMNVALPQPNARMQDWQAVVIGGGLINGLSQQDVWPHERFAELIGNNRNLRARWNHSLDEAVAMSDREETRSGTRYDALRMVAMLGWSRSGAQLVKYLSAEDQPELQMGAVSGLIDVPDPPATTSLIDGLGKLKPRNLKLALAGLVRSEARMRALLEAIKSGQVAARLLDGDTKKALLNAPSAELKQLAETVLGH